MDWTSDSEAGNYFDWISDHGEEGGGGGGDDDAGAASLSDSAAGTSRAVGRSASDEAGPSRDPTVSHFVAMGFDESMVVKAIAENGGENTEAILETLLTHNAIENPPSTCIEVTPNGYAGSESDDQSLNGFGLLSDDENSNYGFTDDENFLDQDYTESERVTYEKDKLLSTLVDMGFAAEEASSAIDRCGSGATVLEIADSIQAAQLAGDAAAQDVPYIPRLIPTERLPAYYGSSKRRMAEEERMKRKQMQRSTKRPCITRGAAYAVDEERESMVWMPNPMVGFGLPNQPPTPRTLPESATGPPYFYYENVALAPKGVWDTISRFLYDIRPEFVDSKYFSAATRKRGYIHNLPIKNRFTLLPLAPRTIVEALPMTKRWWPKWDKRTQLNCLQTVMASARLTDRIRQALAEGSDPPPQRVQQYVIEECRKWNLVWVGSHKVAPLEPDEMEAILGFPKDHTRGGGISRTERYRSLGNTFQVDTVAYHLSVLKEMFPGGITVLSLFSGIGGAEVALHRLGIRMKAVVSVELLEINRNLLRAWWEQTNQRGTLIEICDVQQLDGDRIEQFIGQFGGFDLVIGGSPCNNLSGSNRYSRDGLEGEKSALFYDYFRILDIVKCAMGKNL